MAQHGAGDPEPPSTSSPYFARSPAGAGAPPSAAPSPAASGPAAQTAGDEFDDSFLQDFDVDAAVRRHSAGPAGVAGGAKRAASPGGADYSRVAKRQRSYTYHLPEAEAERRLATVPQSIRAQLLEHQLSGLRALLQSDGRALLADGMGLGKTLTAIAFAAAFRECWPVMVILPSSVRSNWVAELQQWLPSEWLDEPAPAASWAHRRAARKSRTPAAVHAVATAAELPPTADGLAPITLVSYDLLPKIPEAQRPTARIVICDESHALKNREAARTIAVVPLLHSAERVLLM